MTYIRSTLAAALLVFGGAVVSSAQQVTPTPQRPLANGARGRLARNLRGQLFRGITLSDAEKANLKAVRAKYAPQIKALRAELKPKLLEARAARQRGDTAALKALWQQSSAQRDQTKQLLMAERNDIRAALTPEHQPTFDANVARLKQRIAQRAQKMKGSRRSPGA